ncbi:MAG: prolyl-tRNA synthetase associated domain-containing protein [Clostridia bacterium]|nr:prolyl-tRNA synthetase associated domain-containing protein [Clostridia bacterium]
MEQKEQVLAALDALHIPYEVIEHPPVHTMEEMDALGVFTKGEACKNLFLRNASGKIHYVVSLCKDKHPDIQTTLRSQLGSSRLSFGSDERLMKHLGLLPGAVSPFGILNDPTHDVVVALDRDLLNRDVVGFHPNVNTAFVWLKPADLVRFVEAQGNDLLWIGC